MKIVGIIKPFDMMQKIYVFNEGDNIETVSTTLEDFNNIIANIKTEKLEEVRPVLEQMGFSLQQGGTAKIRESNGQHLHV